MRSRVKGIILDLGADFLGASIYAFGINVFTAPNKIAPGGVTGLATILNFLIGVPIGTTTFVINIPLLILSYKFLSKKMTLKTLKSIVIMSFMLDTFGFKSTYLGEPLLAGLFGGILIGIGLSFIFLRHSTTGGVDIIVRLIQLKLSHFPIGRLMMCVDFTVLLTSAIVFKNIESLMYGIVAIFACSKTVDAILYGLYKGKLVHVFSSKSDIIAQQIIEKLGRGATFLKAEGAYTRHESNVLLCAVRNSQFPHLKKIVYQNDPKAFIIVTEAMEILGEGFNGIEDKQ